MSDPAATIIRTRVVYHGHVQGVGFRATCLTLARSRPVVGYVRNVPDGTVELEAEGAPSAVADLLEAIHQYFGTNIHDAQRQSLAPLKREARFEIRY